MPKSKIDTIERLTKAEAAEASTFDRDQAQALVGLYYDIQGLRKAMGNRRNALERRVDLGDSALVGLLWKQLAQIENNAQRGLKKFAEGSPLGRWAMSNYGVGEVITGGLLAHIDVARAPTAGGVWRFAGLDPTCEWKEGQKRPYNAQLKTICWNLGECFKKFSNHPDCFYGHLYRRRKEQEVERNNAGLFAEQAQKMLNGRQRHKTLGRVIRNISNREKEARAVWATGKLQAGGLDLRSTRFAVKIFLSHYHAVGRQILGLPVSRPWVIQFGGHVHEIAIPNWPMEETDQVESAEVAE